MISLLNRLIDSLYLRVGSRSIASAWLLSHLQDFRDYKENFDYSKPEPFYLEFSNLGKFRLLPSGNAPYEFVFTNPEICDIRFFNPEKFISTAALQTGQIYLDFHSKYLQSLQGNYSIISQFIADIKSLCFQFESSHFAAISRADLAADFSGFGLGWDDLKLFATRARKIDGFAAGEDAESILSSLDTLIPRMCDKGGDNASFTENSQIPLTLSVDQYKLIRELLDNEINTPFLDRVICRKNLQTIYIGRFASKLYARLYTKSKEIKVSQKEYMRDIWLAAGWNTEDEVVRTEFSCSGDFLREFFVNGVELRDWYHFIENIPQLWSYLTTNWLRHTTGENDVISRSPNSEFWETVQIAFEYSPNFERSPKPAPPSETLVGQLFAQARGCIKTGTALILGGYHKAFGYPKSEQIEYLEILLDEIGKELKEEITFQDIEERRDFYGCDEFSDTMFSAALRKHRLKLGRGS